MFYKKSLLKNFAKFTGKHLNQNLFFDSPAIFFKKALAHVFSSEHCKISKSSFFTEYLRTTASVWMRAIFTKEELLLTKQIPKARIHVERFNEQLKKFRLLDNITINSCLCCWMSCKLPRLFVYMKLKLPSHVYFFACFLFFIYFFIYLWNEIWLFL